MKNYISQENSFKKAKFSLTLPKITTAEPFINIDFQVIFLGKTKSAYVLKECCITDKLGNSVVFPFDGLNNFFGNHPKPSVAIEAKKLLKTSLTVVITLLTSDKLTVDVTYYYERNKPVVLKNVAIANMTEEEKKLFYIVYKKEEELKNVDGKTPPPLSPTHDFDEYIDAVYSEMFYLKNNGGKKYKVTDGNLLTPNSNEYCYSFELESELYLSDDAPISVLKGLETIGGTVIMCDGFQIIVSLERNIGEKVPSAEISVEPWKLLEKLNENIKEITPSNAIAWKLFHVGPKLAAKVSDVSEVECGQEAAIRHALNNDITVIWGPPGTGKTYTMAQMAERFVSMGKSVLIVSHSNISVDNVVKQISNQFSKNHLSGILSQGKVLRYGFVRDEELSKNDNCVAFNFTLNQHPNLKNTYFNLTENSKKLRGELQFRNDVAKAAKLKEIEVLLKKIRNTLKEETKKYTKKAQVVATTVSKIYMDNMFVNWKFDVVMFDEVSMAYVPQLLCAATFAKEHFICVGDFRQLPPIVQSEKAKSLLQKDIFSFLNISKYSEIYNHPWLVMLNEQRRMHPDISKFSSQKIYKHLLKNHSSVNTKWDNVVLCDPLPGTAMALVDTYGTFCAAGKNADNSRFNIVSALLSFAVALKSEDNQKVLPFKAEEKVGIITPYAAQTRLIRAIIQDYRQKETTSISCATVHQFQGSERNVVVFDAVESYPFVKPGWLVAKNDNSSVMRLINVALTRARCKFITIANTRFWTNKFQNTQNTYYKLLGHIKEKNTVVELKENGLINFIKSLDFGKNIKPYYDEAEARMALLTDIKSAKKKIIITLSTDSLNQQHEAAIAAALKIKSNSGITIMGKAKDITNLNKTWQNMLFKSKDASFPLIVIDDRITWYGFPLVKLLFEDKNAKFISVVNPIFRITGKHTNEMIHSLCDLDHRIDDNGFRVNLIEKNSKSVGGLTKFIHDTEKCSECGASMELKKGISGKYSLKCSSCQNTSWLPYQSVNKYLDIINAKCSVCGKDIYAGVGQYGVYVKCSNGHYTKLSELS